MRRPAALLGICSVLAAGCKGGSARHPAGPPARSSPGGPGAPGNERATAPPSPRRLPEIELTVDLSAPPASWAEVMAIPFGPGEERLGLVTDPHRTPIPYLPRSFAVAPDGTLWILDVVKERIAHYAMDGRYLGRIAGLAWGLHQPQPRDVVFSGGGMYLVQDRSLIDRQGSLLTSVDPEGRLRSTIIRSHGREVDVSYLFQAQGVGAWVNGYADPLGTGPDGPLQIARPSEGALAPLPGIPFARGRWIAPAFVADDRMEVEQTDPSTRTVQPVRFVGIAHAGGAVHRMPIEVGAIRAVQLNDAVAFYLRAAPSRAQDGRRYGDGRWYLRMGHGPLLWERLPEGGVDDANQARHLAGGPDGSVYLMLVNRDEVVILKRP